MRGSKLSPSYHSGRSLFFFKGRIESRQVQTRVLLSRVDQGKSVTREIVGGVVTVLAST